MSLSAAVIEDRQGREKKKKTLFHQKWHQSTVAILSSIGP
jgi:hypothetical protein